MNFVNQGLSIICHNGIITFCNLSVSVLHKHWNDSVIKISILFWVSDVTQLAVFIYVVQFYDCLIFKIRMN